MSLCNTLALSGATTLVVSLCNTLALSGVIAPVFSKVESVVEGVLLYKLVESIDIESIIEDTFNDVSLLSTDDCKVLLLSNFLVFKNCLLNLILSFKSKIPAKEFTDTLP